MQIAKLNVKVAKNNWKLYYKKVQKYNIILFFSQNMLFMLN